jgi:hypothetical protein
LYRIESERSLSLKRNLESNGSSPNNNEMTEKDNKEMDISDPVQMKKMEADIDDNPIKKKRYEGTNLSCNTQQSVLIMMIIVCPLINY